MAHPRTAWKPHEGAVGVVTGAGWGGIGFEVALHLAQQGVHVTLADISHEALEDARRHLVERGIAEDAFETRVADVSNPDDMRELADSVFAARGRVDFLHLNAGRGGSVKAYGEGIVPEWHDIFAVNLFGVVNGTQAFVDRMIAQDSPATVVITGSKQGITCPPGTSAAYNASKAAVKALAESLSHQLLPTQVSVHLLVPGYTYTKMTTNSSSSSCNPSSKPAAAWSPAQVSSYLFSRITSSTDDFYVICPDNNVSWELDKARMQWAYEDITEGRPALSRWHPGWEEKHKAWVEEKLAKK
ncbi:hypothetical protein JCM10296v2_004514 [Rhodotorula toruloides]